MRFESILQWQRAVLEKAAAEQNASILELVIELLHEWANDEYWDYVAAKAEEYNYILEEQEGK